MARTIRIDPITRLEGHGKIEIFLNDDGSVKDCHFQIPELRGFERFVVGRPIEELPRIVTRICGVCPASHHLAGAKAVDGCFGGELPPLAAKLRDMYYQAHYIHSHIAHFFALAAPDLALGLFLAYADAASPDPWVPKALLAALAVARSEGDQAWLRGRLEPRADSPYVLAARGEPALGLEALEEELARRLEEMRSR